MGQLNWNVEFWNNILKKANPQAWPNLIVGSALRIGDYGPLPSVSSGFRYAGNIFVDGIASASSTQGPAANWSASSGQFQQKAAGLSISGEFWDPETASEVTAGLEWSWLFTGGESIIANLPVVNVTELSSPAQVMQGIGPSSPLFQAAAALGYTSNNQIKPNFALVTATFTVAAGVVICTTAKNQLYSITGAASGMDLLMSGQVGGYYTEYSQIDDTQTWIVPPDGVAPTDPVPAVASSAAQATIGYVVWTWNGKGGFGQYQPH